MAEGEKTYIALRTQTVGTANGPEERQRGDLIPEAADWADIAPWVNQGWIEEVDSDKAAERQAAIREPDRRSILPTPTEAHAPSVTGRGPTTGEAQGEPVLTPEQAEAVEKVRAQASKQQQKDEQKQEQQKQSKQEQKPAAKPAAKPEPKKAEDTGPDSAHKKQQTSGTDTPKEG